LLHATAVAAQRLGLQVAALHVHHGLSRFADAWAEHCHRQCAQWQAGGLPVRLLSRRLAGKPARGESIEAWARSGRYQALQEMAKEAGSSLIVLAHHRRDQAETWLLQALRGAGVAGLASMPEQAERSGLTWARPWLDQPREAIEAYVRAHGLSHIEDDSNSDPRFLRNRLRRDLWPHLLEAFPQAEAALVMSASWAQEALALQLEIAQADLTALADARGLRLQSWLQLSSVRRSNALRAWLQQAAGRSAPASLVQRLLRELSQDLTPASWPFAGGVLRRYRGRLSFDSALSEVSDAPRLRELSIHRAGRYRLAAWGGLLRVERVSQGGLPLALLASVQLRDRQGGEQFQRTPRSSARSLKKAYQAAGLSAWQRGGPLLFSGDQLLFVPGLGIDARVLAEPGVPQVRLSWEADSDAAQAAD
jgi:tRNA(Ile)-lysidine synthase